MQVHATPASASRFPEGNYEYAGSILQSGQWTPLRVDGESLEAQAFQGTTMASGRDLPHDLAQFVVEATLSLQHGFWGLLASGATFKSIPGRRRTRPGQQLIQAHGAALNATEHLVNAHVARWRVGASTPIGPALDAMLVRWRALPVGEELRVDWLAPRLASHHQVRPPAPPPTSRRRGQRSLTLKAADR